MVLGAMTPMEHGKVLMTAGALVQAAGASSPCSRLQRMPAPQWVHSSTRAVSYSMHRPDGSASRGGGLDSQEVGQGLV
jgi:hypothetical protein